MNEYCMHKFFKKISLSDFFFLFACIISFKSVSVSNFFLILNFFLEKSYNFFWFFLHFCSYLPKVITFIHGYSSNIGSTNQKLRMPSDLSKRMIHDRCIIISIPAACIIKSVNDKNKL